MPIRRIEGATPAPVIKVNGKDVTLWNHGTIADGVKLTVNTLGPICSAINDGYGDLSAAIDDESNHRKTKDDDLQDQIDTLKAATDVIMVYSAYSDFSSNSGSLTLTDNDVIKVLNDEERQENQTYYQYSTDTSAWSFIGKLDPYYSKNDLENAAGKNINITTANDLKINTNDNVNFDSVSASTAYGSSAKFTNISATNTTANLFKTTEFGAVDTWQLEFDVANGARLTATEAKVLTLTSNTLYGQSNNSNVDTLIGSAQSGAEASAWINNTLFDYSFTDSVETETTSGSIDKIKILYKNDVTDHDVMHNQELVFSRGNYSVSGLLIQAANSNDNGKVLTYNSTANNYTWQPIPDSTYTNGDDNITIDNANRTIGLATSGINTSAYSATYIGTSGQYDSILNGQTLHFSYGHGGLDISFTGVSYYGGGSQGSSNWDNLFQNYAQVNRNTLSNDSLTADRVNFIVATGPTGTQPYKAVNFKITASVPPILDDDVYYII